MILPLLLGAAIPAGSTPAAPIQAGPSDPNKARYDHCVDLATGDNPAGAEREAGQWQLEGGGFLARQCRGMAFATESLWSAAAAEFEAAAHGAEIAHDDRAPNYWAQAGNAWLAGGDPVKARAALDAALAPATMIGLPRGEAELDRARALVAVGTLAAARIDIDHALVDAAEDPLAWLLSATLARRMKDLPRAKKDIAEALTRSADDPSVQLEAGNIAAASGDAAGAKAAWATAARLKPASDAGRSAAAALRQFDAPGG
ncbi:MAG: hypothetical protein ABIS14_07795 [Sphingomonas sp.]